MILDQIVGHEKTIKRLKKVLSKKPLISHALLFCGPSGVGKKKTAMGWAQGLLCREKAAPCGKCHACIRVAHGHHPDLLILELGDAVSHKIEQIRQTLNFVSMKAYEGAAKVVIIDEAQAMTLQAANALLKTLEEPPPDSHFILVTSNRGAIIPTIQSRCQRLLFGNLAPDELKKIVPGAQGWIVELAQGSAETASKLMDESHLKKRLLAMKFLRDLSKSRIFEGFTAVGQLSEERESALFVTRCWSQALKISLALKLGTPLVFSPDEKEVVEQLNENYSAIALASLGQKVFKLQQDISANVNRSLAFEKFFIDAQFMKSSTPERIAF